MEQIFYTTTEDGLYEIALETDGEYIYIYIDSECIDKVYDPQQTYETVDIDYYVGKADYYYNNRLA